MTLPPYVSFSRVALASIGVCALFNFFQAATATDLPILIFVNIGCLIAMSLVAIQFHKENRTGFDAVVAAETIVAFGVAALILSLVSAIYPLVGHDNLSSVFQSNGIARVAIPFLEGLGTAGLAPIGAMVLRNRIAELDGGTDPIGDTTGLTRAMANLTREMEAARKGVAELQASVSRAAVSTTSLADTVQTESERLKLVLLEAQSDIRAFGGAADRSGEEIGELTTRVGGLSTETTKLKVAVSDTGTMLDALGKLIDSIERFVAPGARRRR